MRRFPALPFLLAISGCTSELLIFEHGREGEIPGVPFRGSEVWVAEGYLTAHSKVGACKVAPFQEYINLPTGRLYYAHPDPGWLADSEFLIAYNENGSLKQIQLNSQSEVTESIGAISGLLATTLPFLAAPRGVQDVSDRGEVPACDAGKNVRSFVNLDEWSPDTWSP